MHLFGGKNFTNANYFECKKSKVYFLNVLLVFTFLNLLNIYFPSSSSALTPHTLTITSSGAESIDVIGRDNGTSIGVDNINVATTCRYGYNFTISTSVNNNNLYLNGNSSNNASGSYFTPADGTTALSNSTNKWGYYYNSSAPTTDPTSSNIFSAVPALNSTPAIIKSASATPSAADINENFNLYYGVSSSTNLVPGTYRMIPDTNNNNNPGTIIYQATMAENCIPYTIQFNPTSTASGSSISGTGTMSPQEAYSGDTINLSPMSFTPPSGYEFVGWNTKQDGTGDYYEDEEEITGLTFGGGTVILFAQWRIPPYLYNAVANLVKTSNGSPQTQTLSDMQAVITEPTSSNPATDTSNSGVFLYDATTFGTASDASNDYPIYYYRGILDSNLSGSYTANGSIGNSAHYPNYVKLDNGTCWRIVRTTGSGGVKMIYNGLYGDSASGSCANSATNATTKTLTPFSSSSALRQYVGYTYNPNVSGNSWVPVDTAFGTDANYSTTNTADSTLKDFLENTWYVSNMADYTDILEPSAGYCNERVFYYDSGNAISSVIPDASYAMGDYSASSALRNFKSGGMLTLACQRQIVDLYTTPTANNGNKQLKYPIALLTADELALSGSGRSSNQSPTEVSSFSSNYSYSSYLESYDTRAWLMSPDTKTFTMTMGYGLSAAEVNYNQSYTRPVVSLIHDVYVVSGNGTATKPWLISTEKPKPTKTINLYNAVEQQSKGTQTTNDLQSTINTSNSGVYEYNSSVFNGDTDGTKSDSTKAKIYYYRGILDNNTGSYGSNGDGEAYPNYVILSASGEPNTSDTCWRIVRTTGSGGVKMIYNGTWTGTTCANSGSNAQITTLNYNTFNARYVVAGGYTYNSSYSSGTSTSNVAISTLFGSNANYANNSSSSNAKNYIENTWFSNINAFSSLLEGNAGYCNDRSLYNTSNTLLAESTTIRRYYTRTGTEYRFGAYIRNGTTAQSPTLSCPRSTVDLYTTSDATSGNKQLSQPIAMLTADEASFAGSGSTTANQGSSTNANSFLNSGSNYLLMSPNYRNTSNYVYIYYLSSSGSLNRVYTNTTGYGVRPVISLKEGTEAQSGTGTAADPWVVVAP